MNFDYFPIQRWMLQTVRAKKCGHLSSFNVSILVSLNCRKKSIFCNFVLTSARTPSLLKQFTCMHLKNLVTLFQKVIWFIWVWATVLEILKNGAESAKISQNSSTSNHTIFETISHSMISNTIFWKQFARIHTSSLINIEKILIDLLWLNKCCKIQRNNFKCPTK